MSFLRALKHDMFLILRIRIKKQENKEEILLCIFWADIMVISLVFKSPFSCFEIFESQKYKKTLYSQVSNCRGA